MTIKAMLSVSTASFAIIALSSLVAQASDQAWAAFTVCTYDLNGNLVLDGGGVKNTGASDRSIVCSVGQEQALDTNDDVLIYYTETSTTSAMPCGVLEYTADLVTQTLGDVKWACSTTGGCAGAPPNSYAGSGFVRLADISHGVGWISYTSCSAPANTTIHTVVLDEQ